MGAWFQALSFVKKLLLGIAVWFVGFIVFLLIFGNSGKNDEFKPQDEFKLHDWIPLQLGGINFSINRAVLYLVLASALTIWVMTYIARRMQMKPNRVQAAVEAAYDLTKNNITGGNMPSSYATRWFPFIATLFFFIAFSNILGYLPLPTNSAETIDIFGLAIPSFAIYAATANISFPLVLTLVVWFSYHLEGVRAHGVFGYL